MTAHAPHDIVSPPGVSVEVLWAGAAFVAGVSAMAAAAARGPGQPGIALLGGWPAFALAGTIVLDRRPGESFGRALVALGLSPVLVLAWASLRAGSVPSSFDVVDATDELAGVLAAAAAVVLPLSIRAPLAVRPGAAGAAVAAAGAVVVGFDAVWGWALLAGGSAIVCGLVVAAIRTDHRDERRRGLWALILLAATACIVTVAALALPSVTARGVTAGALIVLATALARVWLAESFRPLDEPALDLAVLVAAVAAAVAVGFLVYAGLRTASLPSPRTSAAFSALVTLTLAAPAALWVRRGVLARRYGSGIIAPSDVAVITADLHAQTEPRDLLGKAARMVATASGSRDASIVLGPDDPIVPEHWVVHRLVVGGDQVGALLVQPEGPEGPELRQQRVVEQLLPTVALVARAVGLAVEAEHARRDVARERDAERGRIMGDLHDGLGPVLAGMSMRVQAALRSDPAGEYAGLLADLAAGLSTSRTDLRRIVSGLTPSALHDGNLESALDRLVESFRATAGGPRVSLELEPCSGLSQQVQVAVYRSVAEGITNALRHARASAVSVTVRCRDGRVDVEVVDDGRGGPVVAGVGLSSLRQRATSLGGWLEVEPGETGVRLHLELPVGASG